MVLKNEPKILGLDISTKTIGWALFGLKTQKLLELTHFSPRVNPRPEDKMEEHLKKAEAFGEKLDEIKGLGVIRVIIEEPLLTSNNLYTVGTLLRYNSIIVKTVYDKLKIVPSFISTYNSRKYAHPALYGYNNKGKKVLFGGFPKDTNKKIAVLEQVKILEPHIVWPTTKNDTPTKECFDMADAYTCVRGHMLQNDLW